MIILPSNFVASTTQYVAIIFNDLSPLTELILGVLLATAVIVIIIEAIRGHK
jgi:hypothetical protein